MSASVVEIEKPVVIDRKQNLRNIGYIGLDAGRRMWSYRHWRLWCCRR